MKVHRIAGGVRGAIEREWYTVWTVCSKWINVDPPSRSPRRASATWKNVDCERCKKLWSRK